MKALRVILAIGFLIIAFFVVKNIFYPSPIKSPVVPKKPLEKYTFENLKKTTFPKSDIKLGEVLKDEDKYTSQMFYYDTNGKKVSGLINIPKEDNPPSGGYPIIVMIRGFVPKEIFSTGVGTQRDGEYFAENGFITLAPDFLGYGESDNPSQDPIEERFQTYTTVLSLISSLDNLNAGLSASYSAKIKADTSKVGIWGHSNGGHISIATLEITGKNYPTVLWAPVSKPFPYSIFYYMDEYEDHGKALRKVVANFEKDYDIELYSPSNYYSWINAPIQLHQGENDDAVPIEWSNDLYKDLKALGKDITYFTYENSDHNLSPDGWNTAIQRSLEFFQARLQ